MNHEEMKLQIGANIARLRREAGLTQAELAERLNYSDKAVSKWERGESMPDVLTLIQLTQELGAQPNDLVSLPSQSAEAPAPAQEPEPEKAAKAPAQKPKPIADKGVIQKLSSLLVWIVALFIYLVLDSFGLKCCWMIFLVALIANAIVLLILRSIWKMYGFNRVLISVIMWGTLAFFHLTIWLIWNVNVWRVFLLGLLGQAAITLWFKMFKYPEESHE